MPDKLKVCFICTGNRARSPIAEHALREVAGDQVEVDSAGVLDLGGAPALPEAVTAAARHGFDLSGHRSKALTSIDPDVYDMFIGFELSHVAFATVEAGIPHAKVFTLPELLRLLDGAGSADSSPTSRDPRVLLETAATGRTSDFDIEEQLDDPLGRPATFFAETAARITKMCTDLANVLFSKPTP